MAAKRRAGNYLTDRNWEDEDENVEQAGTFETAGSKAMAKRVIKKARRRVKAGETEDAEDDDVVKPSPFAGFAFGANKPSGGFSFKSQTPASFSLKSSTAEKPSATDTAVPTTIPTGIFGVPKPSSTSDTNGTNGSNKSGPPTTSTSSMEYEKKLQNLNLSVSSWIQKHVTENPVCDLTPVFEDYKKHLTEIEKLKTTVETNQSVAKPLSTSTASSFSFGKSSDVTEVVTSSKVDFSFKASAAPSTSTPASTFSFGSNAAGSGFGSSAATTGTTGSLFGSAQPFTFGTAKSTDSTKTESQVPKPQGNDEDYEPPKVEVSTVTEKDSLFSKRCKLFYKKGDGYKDRGVGLIHLKKPGKSLQLLVRADTNLGNILLNIMIPSALPVSRQGKNNLIIMTPINPPVDRLCSKCNKKYPSPQESNVCDNGCSPEATALLIRVKSGDEADELLKEINKLKNE
ncbi:nuclear pore complex protein Nup50-like [Asterias amurensis]|uniref:nuclear pore complex protein Nup50-like n=1 Tax=Asterias amurensis TaxID=7602 RepID=UPI003AB27799